MIDAIPLDLDWVTERAKCTAVLVFQQLQIEVEKDVKLRDDRVPKGEREDHIGFGFKVLDQDNFVVNRSGANIVSRVLFKLNRSKILALDAQANVLVEAAVTLNDLGRCVLLVNKAERERWQFRKEALHALFFEFWD